MTSLLAFMVVVSCSDGFQDCRLVDNILPYQSMTTCEEALYKKFSTPSMQQGQYLGRCVAGRPSLAANDNAHHEDGPASKAQNAISSENKEILGQIAWEVSKHGDLMASLVSANDNTSKFSGQGEEAFGAFYQSDIASHGIKKISYGVVSALNSGVEQAKVQSVSVQFQTVKKPFNFKNKQRQSFYGAAAQATFAEYKNKKNASFLADRTLSSLSPKYIYEQNSAVEPLQQKIKQQNKQPRLAIGRAGFQIMEHPKASYTLPPKVVAILQGRQPTDSELSTKAFANYNQNVDILTLHQGHRA